MSLPCSKSLVSRSNCNRGSVQVFDGEWQSIFCSKLIIICIRLTINNLEVQVYNMEAAFAVKILSFNKR